MRSSFFLRFIVFLSLFSFFAFLPSSLCYGQAVAGMTGTVTDQSDAAIPGVVVTLTNITTGSKYTQTTNETGFYRFASVPPGAGYQVTFAAKGFAVLQVKDIYLTVNEVRTQNATMGVSARQEVVEVSAANSLVTLNTTDATVGNDLPVQSINSLPVQQRSDPTALFTLQAGVSVDGSVAGARVDQNYISVDGLDVNDFATGNASQTNSGVASGFEGGIVGHAPVDSVEQFHAGVAGNSADTGAAGGGQFALVTKSGTNQFHGNLNEYHRDPSLVANSWFSNNASPKVPRNHLIQNQFGGAVGGPITIPHFFSGKDRAFFFFDYNDSRVIQSALVQRIVPTDTFRKGIIKYYASDGSIQQKTPADVKAMDPAGQGELSTWMNLITSRMPTSNSNATGDGLNSTGFIFNDPANDYLKTYVGRVDFNLNDRMKLFARFTVSREDAVNAAAAFKGDPVTSPVEDRSYAWVIGHNWLIGNSMNNRVWLGETVQKLSFPDTYNPMGSTAFTMSDGSDSSMTSNLYTWPSSQARRIPIPVLGDDFFLTKGNHIWQWGGTFKDILAHNTNVTDFNLAEIGLGGETAGLCGPDPGDCGYVSAGGAANPSLRPSDIDTSQALSWDEPFAFTLGRIGNVNSTYNYDKSGSALTQMTGDQRFYRYYQMQLYVQDTWKLKQNLTVNYGLTYQWLSVPYETRGLESVEPFTFNQYLQARVAQSQLGQTGPNAVPIIPYYLGGKGNGSNAPGIYQPEYRDFAPHVGFSWNVGSDKKTVVNGSAGIIYDRTVIMAVQTIQDSDSYLFQQSKVVQNGISGDPYNSIKGDARLDSKNGLSNQPHLGAPATPKPPYQPFTDSSYCANLGFVTSPCGLQDGYAFNATIDPALKTPYSLVFDLGVQRDLPWNMILKATFVSRLGRRLLGQPDAEQVIDFADPKSGQTFGQAFGEITSEYRNGIKPANMNPQPWFEDVVEPGIGQSKGFTSNTTYLASANSNYVNYGDMADFNQSIAATEDGTGAPITPLNAGMPAQFSENTFYTNAGFSTYHGLLVTLSKNLSHGAQFDVNYTWSHSIDNVSFFANSSGDTGIGSGIGLICDVIRPRECRARSDFDLRHLISVDGTYQLPFGKGREFFNSVPTWAHYVIDKWDLSGVGSFHTGLPWSTASNAFVASYSNDAPARFTGSDPSVIKNHINKLPSGGVVDFSNQSAARKAFTGPVGFTIGPRNQMTGPNFFNADMGLQKTFPVYGEGVNLKFRADAFNVLNHPNFGLPIYNGYNGFFQIITVSSQFGKISSTVEPPGNSNHGARVLQLSLRLDF